MFGLSKREKCIREALLEVIQDTNRWIIIRPSIMQVSGLLQDRLEAQHISITRAQACKHISKYERSCKKIVIRV